MAEPNYTDIIQRIIDILKADVVFSAKVKEFRFGELPEKTFANSYPACYVATADNPEMSREGMAAALHIDVMPAQKIVTEFWVIFVTSPQATAAGAQKLLFDLRADVIRILSRNIKLKKPYDNTEPLCSLLEFSSVKRFTKQRGKVVDAMNIMVRTINYRDSPVPSTN